MGIFYLFSYISFSLHSESLLIQCFLPSDITAESPILFIPHAATSKDVLVAYLGNLTWRNQILTSGNPGTINYEQHADKITEEGESRIGNLQLIIMSY